MTAVQGGRKILIAVDGSENSKEAFHNYVKKIFRPGDETFILYVQDEPPVEPWPKTSHYYEDWNSIMKSRKEQAEYIKTDYVTEWEAFGLDVKIIHPMVEEGTPGCVICKVADEEEVDLIIVGSRGHGPISRTLLGSVSSYCVHHARKPVLVVPTLRDHH